jgi:hypothetical protein
MFFISLLAVAMASIEGFAWFQAVRLMMPNILSAAIAVKSRQIIYFRDKAFWLFFAPRLECLEGRDVAQGGGQLGGGWS